MSRTESPERANLLIVDDEASPALENVRQRAAAGEAWDVLLLGLSVDWYTHRHPPIASLHLIDVSPIAPRAHAEVAAFLVPYVHALGLMPLGERSLQQLMTRPDSSGEPEPSPWWYAEITEKGPYRGPLVGQLYRVAVAAGVIASKSYQHVAVSLADVALRRVFARHASRLSHWSLAPARNELRPLTRRFPLAALAFRIGMEASRLIGARFLAKVIAATTPTQQWRGRPIVFTFFPEWWSNWTSARPSDRFFGAPADGGVAGYLAWCSSLRQLWRHRGSVTTAMRDLQIRPLQSWSRLGDISYRSLWHLWIFLRSMRAHVQGTMCGFDVAPLVSEELTRSLASVEMVRNRVVARAVRRAVANARPSAVLYRLEWQPLENALLAGVSGLAAGVGYLHYPFGDRYLATRFSDGELSTPSSSGRDGTRPMPDAIVASGRALLHRVTSQGYPENQTALIGPQRYVRLIGRRQSLSKAERKQRLGVPPSSWLVVVAPAILPADAAALAAALLVAARQIPSIHVILRTHPNQPDPGPAMSEVMTTIGPDSASLMPRDADLYEYLESADCLLCIGSMIAFEAMALGTMPVVFENPATYAATSLREFEPALYVVTDGASLAAALAELAKDGPGARARRVQWPATIDSVLGDLDQPAGRQLTAALGTLLRQ